MKKVIVRILKLVSLLALGLWMINTTQFAGPGFADYCKIKLEEGNLFWQYVPIIYLLGSIIISIWYRSVLVGGSFILQFLTQRVGKRSHRISNMSGIHRLRC